MHASSASSPVKTVTEDSRGMAQDSDPDSSSASNHAQLLTVHSYFKKHANTVL